MNVPAHLAQLLSAELLESLQQADLRYMRNPAACPQCHGERWVYEDHPERPYRAGDVGVGMPCPLCNPCDHEHPPVTPSDYRRSVASDLVLEYEADPASVLEKLGIESLEEDGDPPPH